ncbi:MAG: hypothetical protein JSU83_21705 [Deltaproteobacteria bacterium]|nr:MAG: hypothetical protein JSU83_21705 [Deltaproteobacteria bacterium]
MKSILERFDLLKEQSGAGTGSWLKCRGEILESISAIDGCVIGKIRCAGKKDYQKVIKRAVNKTKCP